MKSTVDYIKENKKMFADCIIGMSIIMSLFSLIIALFNIVY